MYICVNVISDFICYFPTASNECPEVILRSLMFVCVEVFVCGGVLRSRRVCNHHFALGKGNTSKTDDDDDDNSVRVR